ncbi:MAG: shikimate kinase [Bacteroidetes bacterium]|nr:shikimate kinase [Bacteroidota bacterium]
MGSGKTTIGKKLAKSLRCDFVDLDDYIEKKERLTIQTLFENFGEATFRKIEQTCLNELLSLDSVGVVSLGGGTICYENNLEKIKKSGTLIYLELPAVTLMQRLEKSMNKRPLLKNLKGEELLTFINNKLSERQNFYNKAHITISGLNLTAQMLQQKIIDQKK